MGMNFFDWLDFGGVNASKARDLTGFLGKIGARNTEQALGIYLAATSGNEALLSRLKAAETTLEANSTQITALSKLVFDRGWGLKPSELALAQRFDEKYPKSSVYYEGWSEVVRNAAGSFEEQMISLPEQSWIVGDRFFEPILQEKHLVRSDFLPALEVDEFNAYDSWALQIKKVVDVKYHYVFDNAKYGVNEKWNLPILTWINGVGDCEDYALLYATLLKTAGFPSYRVRVTAGDTYRGPGHCTTYILGSDEQFHHLNSTSVSKFNKLTDAPLRSDSKDDMNIKSVWFAFNWNDAWHQFPDAGTAASFENSPHARVIKFK